MKPSLFRRRGVIAISLVLVVLAALVVLAPSLYDVQDKGRDLVPYDAGSVYKVRVLDTFTLYADSESSLEPDKLTGTALAAAATMTLMTALLLYAAGGNLRLRRFYAWATGGLAFLAADELFAIHESVGHNLQFLADLPGIERPDDVVFMVVGVAALIFVWAFRDVMFSNRLATRMFIVGGGFFVIAGVGDAVSSGLEEPAEVAAALCILAGLVTITVSVLRRELGLGAAQANGAGPTPMPPRQRRATWTTQTVRGRPS
jgi:hypothetical protein